MSRSCPKCSFVSDSEKECPKCGIIYDKFLMFQEKKERFGSTPRPVAIVIEESSRESAEDGDISHHEIQYNSLKINLLAFPVAFGAAFLASAVGMIDWTFKIIFTIPLHELGHSWVAWLGGRFAFPFGAFIPFAAFTAGFSHKSTIVIVAVFALLAYCAYQGFKSRRPYLSFVALSLLGVQLYLSSVATARKWESIMIFGGETGEFIISTLLLISFYYRLPGRLRWDFFRFLFLFPCAFVLTDSFDMWLRISRGQQSLPMGSFLYGSNDNNGDMQRLLNQYGWTQDQLIHSFVNLGKFCVAAIVVHYLYFIYRANRPAKAAPEAATDSE